MKQHLYTFVIALCIATSSLVGQVTLTPRAQVTVSPFEYNSTGDDFGATLTQNSRALYFTSDRGGSQTAFVTDNTNNVWQSPDELASAVNDGVHTGTVSLTPDGQTMVFASYKHNVGGVGRTDLYISRKVNGKWSEPQNLGPNVNSSAWDSQPSLTSDGTTLYFASDRDGGAGKADIYVSRWNGITWSRAEAVSALNTSADDMCPNIAPDNATLYIASDRPGTLGGYDIYTSRLKGGAFSKPINIGEPINSSSNEYFYMAYPNTNTANSQIAYFSSDRAGGSGGIDIYKAVPNPEMPNPVVVMRGIVKDAVTGKELGSTITITDLKTRKQVGTLKSDDETGEYFVTLTAGRSYSITAQSPDHVFYSERVDVPESEKGREVEKDILLTPLKDGSTRLLVFFDTDKADLKDESLPELDRVVDFLRSNDNVEVIIEGHTDDVGEDAYNMQLSKRRAESVKTYLSSAGIAAGRISSMGFGETRPKLKGNSEDIRAQNRRVEMKIKQ